MRGHRQYDRSQEDASEDGDRLMLAAMIFATHLPTPLLAGWHDPVETRSALACMMRDASHQTVRGLGGR
ncbi:MAG: hypothetical protein QOE93_333 [Actinomycetota bacterium]|jgi:hypothetical protein|nr:hypothetical protein [Actinomycetota bacterium]